MSAKTLTIRLEDKPGLAKRLERLLKATNTKTYQSCIEVIIKDYDQQDRTIQQLRAEVVRLQDELHDKDGIINDVKRFMSIPERLRSDGEAREKKKGVKALTTGLFN